MLMGVSNPRGQPHGGASGAPARQGQGPPRAASLLQPAPRSGWWKASSTPGWFSASRAAPALTHSLAARSGIFGKGSGSGDFCCFSWDQRSIPTLSRGGRPRRGTAMGMVTPRGLTSCALPKKPAPGGCWHGEHGPLAPWPAARMVWAGPRKARLACQLLPASLDLPCPLDLPRS